LSGSLTIALPAWLRALNALPRRFADHADAMDFVVAAARQNCDDRGGPFGAAVVDASLGLISVGVNRVVPAGFSMLHAEMVTLALAQQRLGSHDLAAVGEFTLISSCAPCAMCLGAIPFSGVRALVCGARGEDAEAIGFCEGDKPDDWAGKLRARGIAVTEDVGRDLAIAVLLDYRASGGVIY
jgi:tRNA(Arg) A34 adenosine deaminase TadA